MKLYVWIITSVAAVAAIIVKRHLAAEVQNQASPDTRPYRSAAHRPSALPEELVKDLLKRIDRLEQNNFFLDSRMGENRMARMLKTNTAYLSRVINEHKGMNFSSYLRSLRIAYTTKMLTENRVWRKYSVEALAAESGFRNRTTFSNAFTLYHKKSPAAYIALLNRDLANGKKVRNNDNGHSV